jgi:hypothetical protein
MASDLVDLRTDETGPRHNLVATAAPGAGDDITAGYSIGSLWADVAPLPATIYICRDNTEGAATWTQIAP